MKSVIRLKDSIKFKVMVVVFLFVFLVGITSIYLIYRHDITEVNDEAIKDFAVMADIFENDMERWLMNRQNHVEVMAAHPATQQYINQIVTGGPESEQAARDLENYWKVIREKFAIYDEIYIASETGKVLVSTDPSRRDTYRPQDDLINVPLATGKVFFQNAYKSFQTGRPCIAFSAPVFYQGEGVRDGGRFAGVLIYRVDISSVLQPLMEEMVSIGETGQVIVIDNNRTAITELRDRPGSALEYQLQSEIAKRVARGESGVAREIGYNGKEIIAAYRSLSQFNWGIIVCQETSEIFGPVINKALNSIFISLLALMGVLGILYLFLNRFLAPLKGMADVANSIAVGDFTKRIDVKSNDEIGILGQTINTMSEDLQLQFKMQESRYEVQQVLIENLELENLLDKGLNIICTTFNFSVGSIFLMDHKGECLVLKAAYCPGRELMSNQTIKVGEGLEGLAVQTGETQMISDITEDTMYAVNWLGGSILPAAIVSIPLLFGAQALGVITLAAQNKINEESINELNGLASLMAVAVKNALTYEETLKLSYDLQELNEQLAQQNEELNAQGEELASQNEELQTQSEQLHALTIELQDKNDELQRAADLKSRFISTLSHELRAPLNAVISYSEVLLDQVVGKLNLQQEKYVREVLRSGGHLLKLIDLLLDHSRIEAELVELNIEEVDPAVPLEESLAMISNVASRKDLQINNLINAGSYAVLADKDRLEQIFLNLLTNAVKYTPAGGKITIGAQKNSNTLELWVADTGIGIAEEYHTAIFEDFNRGPSGNSAIEGTGLGLAITKRLVEMHGGSIYVESKEGEGATFTFVLPTVPEQESFDSKQYGDRGQESGSSSKGQCVNSNIMPQGISYLQKPLREKCLLDQMEKINHCLLNESETTTVLVIDDDAAVKTYITSVLEPRGYKLICADDGQQGIELAIKHKPDIIILDIVMPKVDGYGVLDELSKYDWEKMTYVIIVTSMDLTAAEKESLALKVENMHTQKNNGQTIK